MSTTLLPTIDEVWSWLAEVPDPEIPVVSVTELGIVRDVRYEDETLVVAVTPTYSGCPATAVIDLMIEDKLREKGVADMRLERRLSPPWTTDWVTKAAREKLKAFGIAPPIDGTASDGMSAKAARLSGQNSLSVACPRCGSVQTERISQFGSTPCKAAWRCKDCLEPFDYFKCI
ncbi:ring-1,2-phenylacetyl-CoA epoxidase subunit PaaD [Labrenzia sp. EL_159]|uniref:1,2-phenylacetyl-CoA epoxidase subunit PaaD n=1 Tax=Roseibium album TaxID=311410 RepID=UPI0018C91AF7|nr:1,2-phenylacetyl-CoA epoxidase subunit PaaD [Roseibium album]MBG6159113.1 ring-1,2-phenylacetyl-CoA epoxidase subunit PaaD [Labrenzia sp. EL_162]MBG6197799.1 ring-1,2-phenylacetyl-CoA epoxidase subunit PaaD [Labrenzia sp. EL_159]MCR9060267.1 phenylacetate-CoA oxygenase subunit PaaJ [Paracoccaceae bacterium]